MSRSRILIALAAGGLALAGPAAAQAPSDGSHARVVAVNGDVNAKTGDGALAPVAQGSEVARGSELHTGIDSEAKLQFADGSVMVVREMSQVLIADLLGEGSRQTIAISVKLGELDAQVNPQKTFQSDFKVTTPTATASVRGTQIRRLSYHPARGTSLFLASGSLLLTNNNGGSTATSPGDTASVDGEGTLVTPAETIAGVLARAKASTLKSGW